jgi:hypothetical protein
MTLTCPDTGPAYFDQRASPNNHNRRVGHDLRIANAIRLRRADIRDEMAACERGWEGAYDLAQAFFDEFNELAETDKVLGAALTQVEADLQRSGAYYVSDEQLGLVLERIAEADIRRFCQSLGVEGVAKIPVHQLDDALAALDAKRRRAA